MNKMFQNRPLEFRAYHTPSQSLFYVDFFGSDYVFAQNILIPYPRAECVLMQFTGLLDSKGQKVFEGDVLYSYYPSHGREPSVEFWRVVAYREGCFCELQYIDEEATIYNLQPVLDADQDTVVGCHYMRPDLLDLNTETGEVPETFFELVYD